MLPSEKLFPVLQNISSSSYKGYGYVRIRSEYAVEKEKVEKELKRRILKVRRYNYAQQPTIYLANSRETLEKQVNKNCLTADEKINQKISPHTNNHNCYQYLQFNFDLTKVLDLRDKLIQDQLGTNLAELAPNEPKNLLRKNVIYPTQNLGNVARKMGYQGLIVPIDQELDPNLYFYVVIFQPNLQSIFFLDKFY